MKKNKEKRHDKRIQITEAGFLIQKDNGQNLIPVKISDVSFNGVGLSAEKKIDTEGNFSLGWEDRNGAPIELEFRSEDIKFFIAHSLDVGVVPLNEPGFCDLIKKLPI